MSVEYLIPDKHTLKILYKSKHFPRRYKRKREWVFFSEHSVYHSIATTGMLSYQAILRMTLDIRVGIHRRMRWGRGGNGKIFFFWQISTSCKIRAFLLIFHTYVIGQKCLAPKLTEILRVCRNTYRVSPKINSNIVTS